MTYLHKLCSLIDNFTEVTGRLVTWLCLLLILATCGVVFLRYGLGGGSIALQESSSYIHASLFMLAMAFTLKHGGHVRVDIFYRNFSPKRQAWVDILGTLIFLFPICILMFTLSLDYVATSWSIRETSQEGSGLPFVYVLKSLLLVLPILLMIQGTSELIKNLLFALDKGGSHTEEHLEAL